MSTTNLDGHLGYWLRLVSNQLATAFARALQERGLSVAEWVALARIDASAGLNCVQLAGALGVTRGAISKVLDKLQDKEWITRTVSDLDSRVQVLALSRRGRRRLPELTRVAQANEAQFFARLDAGEQALLRGLLRKVAG